MTLPCRSRSRASESGAKRAPLQRMEATARRDTVRRRQCTGRPGRLTKTAAAANFHPFIDKRSMSLSRLSSLFRLSGLSGLSGHCEERSDEAICFPYRLPRQPGGPPRNDIGLSPLPSLLHYRTSALTHFFLVPFSLPLATSSLPRLRRLTDSPTSNRWGSPRTSPARRVPRPAWAAAGRSPGC